MSCSQKEIDCFVTHDPVSSSDPEAPNVDEYVGAVWSVQVHRPLAFAPPSESTPAKFTDGLKCTEIRTHNEVLQERFVGSFVTGSSNAGTPTTVVIGSSPVTFRPEAGDHLYTLNAVASKRGDLIGTVLSRNMNIITLTANAAVPFGAYNMLMVYREVSPGYTQFEIESADLKAAIESDYITSGFEVTVSTASTHVVTGVLQVLEPGQSFYMHVSPSSTHVTDNKVTFALAWKPFTDPDSADFVNLTPLAIVEIATGTSTAVTATNNTALKNGVKFLFREKAPVAYVVNRPTSWIMAAYADAPVDLEVGDRVRMGATTLGGFTDYCTVLDKVPITQLGCGIYGVDSNKSRFTGRLTFNGVELQYTDRNGNRAQDSSLAITTRVEMLGNKAVSANTAVPVLVDLPSVAKFPYEATAHDTAWYAYRVSANVDCTLPPSDFTTNGISEQVASKQERLKHRAAITFDDAWASKGKTARKPGERRRFFPCFRLRNDLSKPLVVPFGHTVKCVHEVKLHSYSLLSATQDSEYQHGHELNPTNWVAMELAGVQGEVMSNNPHANGAFAILHAGQMHNDTSSGLNEHYETHPQGLVKVKFERPISTMRELRVSFRNPKGEAPRAARIHLWFKLWVTQG